MKKIDDYTIGELKEIIQQREQKKDWKEKAKGTYCITHYGNGSIGAYNASYKKYDFTYKKESDAELFAKKVDLFNRMNLFALIHNKNSNGTQWVADWKDDAQTKFGIVYYRELQTDYQNRANLFVFGIPVKSREIANAMLEEFKDELEIYLK